MVGLLAGVQSEMRLQVSFLIECLLAILKWTDKITRSIVLLQVHFKALLATVGFIAALDWTDKIFLLLVSLCVIAQVALGHEGFSAAGVRARERTIILQLVSKDWMRLDFLLYRE